VGRLSKKDQAAMVAHEEWAELNDFYPCPKCGYRNPEDGETARWATSAPSIADWAANGVLDDPTWRGPSWEVVKTFGEGCVSPAGFIGLLCKKCGKSWVALYNVGPPL